MAGDGQHDRLGGVALVAGGHDEALDGWDAASRGFGVRVREIDHRDPATADAILRDVVAGQDAGVFVTGIPYRGRHPERWIQHLAPDVLLPRHFGLFSAPGGELLGWFSLMFSLGRRDLASLGIVIKPQWKGKGLGTAATRHAMVRKGTLLGRPVGVLVVATLPTNEAMIHVARKVGLVDCGELPDAGTFKRTFATSDIFSKK